MANSFNSAKMNGAQDIKFQRIYNHLIDILNKEIELLRVQEVEGITVEEGTVIFTNASATESGLLTSADWNTFNTKQDSLDFGILDTNVVVIDSADVATTEYARFTTGGLESRATSEVLSDIGAEPADSKIQDVLSQFEADNTYCATGDATVWEDLRFPSISTKLGGTKDPAFAKFKDNGSASQGVFCYWFDATAEEELYFIAQMPHSWAGTAIKPHVHWTPATTSDGNPASQTVEWGMEYTWADIGSTYGNTAFVYGKVHTPADADVVAGKHYLTPLTDITPSGDQDGLSSMLICRIFRNATDATDDTYEADAGLLEIDFHYEVNTLGSRSELSK